MNSKERPILFSTEMIRALLDRRKTQTRRLIKPQPERDFDKLFESCPFGKVGDRLWVREKIYCFDGHTLPKAKPDDFSNLWDYGCDYATNIEDSELSTVTKTISPIHMPRWCCRIELELTEILIERVADISPADAIAEGLKVEKHQDLHHYSYGSIAYLDPQYAFRMLWNSIHSEDGTTFTNNPWVWVLKFNRIM
jgi:hypothetical protein